MSQRFLRVRVFVSTAAPITVMEPHFIHAGLTGSTAGFVWKFVLETCEVEIGFLRVSRDRQGSFGKLGPLSQRDPTVLT